MKPVIILGAGGHAKVLIDILLLLRREIIGVIDPYNKDKEFMGFDVFKDEQVFSKYPKNEIDLVNAIGSIPGKDRRWQITTEMEQKGFAFSQVIHPSSLISNDVSLGQGVQVMAGVIIQPGTRIGMSSIVNTGAVIDHDCVINENCHIAPGVTLSGSVTVGKGTHIGTGASVIHNISIGDDCIIAAGSIIHEDVSPNTKVIQKYIEN